MVLVAALAACSSGAASPPSPTDASAVIKQLGQVPIPTPPSVAPTPLASPDHPQLLAIGAPVRADLPGGVSAVVTALGPVVVLPTTGPRPPGHAQGTVTITATELTGSLTLRDGDFSSRDDVGNAVPLSPVGPTTVTATSGHPGSLQLTATFRPGSAQITWQSAGKVIAIWDFTIEVD